VVGAKLGSKNAERAAIERGRLGKLALFDQPAGDQRQGAPDFGMIGALAPLLDRERRLAERDGIGPAPFGGGRLQSVLDPRDVRRRIGCCNRRDGSAGKCERDGPAPQEDVFRRVLHSPSFAHKR
jgi:hypothetical protein